MTNRPYLGFLSIVFVVTFATHLPQPFTTNFLANQRGFCLSMIGVLGSRGGLGKVVLNYLLGRLEVHTGFWLGQVGVAVFTLLLWRGAGFEWFALGYFLLGGFQALRRLGIAQIRPFVHESQMGLAYGIAEMVRSSVVFRALPLAGYWYARDPALIYSVGLVAIAIGLAISLIIIPCLERTIPDHGVSALNI